MAESIVLAKAIKLALPIVALYKYLTEQKREFVISKQILLSGRFYRETCESSAAFKIEGRLLNGDVRRFAERSRN